ncbi:MAG: DNA primase [Gammaproteobacteria bacterium]|nr:DNA primase [Gammaproteobacteria bacterium]
MARIPEKFIDELLARVDIVELIDQRVPLKKAGKDYKACCPFHDEKTPSFTVSQTKQFYHCFGCGEHGSAIGFLMRYEHMPFIEAVEELARQVGLEVPAGAAADKPADDLAPISEALQQADRYFRRQLREHPQAHEAIEYLKGRGLSGEIANDFGLGYAPDGWDNVLCALGKDGAGQDALVKAGLLIKKDNGGYYDRFRQRVMFPIHDYRGRIIGFGGRVLGSGEPKYLNSPETPLFHKGRELYGLHRARDAIRREQRVLVVEGYLDVVALAQFGIDYAVATLGTATTRDHLERLFRFAPEVVFCFDGDRAGREAAGRALETALPTLSEGRQVSFLFLPEGEDPDTLVRKEGKDAFSARLAQALSLPDYLFQTLTAQVDLGRLDGRARLAELARPLLSKLPQGVLRQLIFDRLAEITQVDAKNLATLLPGGPAAARPRSPGRAAHQPVPSLVRLAIALLLQHPGLARQVADPGLLRGLERPGMGLLVELLVLLKARELTNAGAILEHFRDSEHQPHLAKLLAWQHPVLDQDADRCQAEFADLVERLRREAIRQQIERLNAKQRVSGSTREEKAELLRLLAELQEFDRLAPRS